MEGFGERLRARARELGWSDSEVARRVGLGQTRYAGYVSGRHEPDLATLVRIAGVLGTSTDRLLRPALRDGDGPGELRMRIAAALDGLDEPSLATAAMVVDGLVARSVAAGPEDNALPR